jgi:hypothetical protein
MRDSAGPDDAPDAAADQHVRPRPVALLRAANDRTARLGLGRPRRRPNFTSDLVQRKVVRGDVPGDLVDPDDLVESQQVCMPADHLL